MWRDEDLNVEAADWAVSDAGRDVLEELLAAPAGQDPLPVASRLRRQGLDVPRAAAALGIAEATRRARAVGHADGTWWTPAALEQASDPDVAAWRAARFAGRDAVDLTAGCGGDALALATRARRLVAAERNGARARLLASNLAGRGHVVVADALAPPMRPEQWCGWADPARRAAGRRLRRLGEVRPSVPALAGLGLPGLGVAVSPGVDLADPDRPADAELEFVQVGRQLVEATLWLGEVRDHGPGERAQASATLLPAGVHRRGTPTGPRVPVTGVAAWLVVPEPALVRARLADRLAEELELTRVARRRALFTSQTTPPASPWLRSEPVEAVTAARPARVRDVLDGIDALPLELLTHGLAADLPGWWRALGPHPRGPGGRAIHLVRTDDAAVAVVTRRHGGP